MSSEINDPIPIACSLTAAGYRQRLDETDAISRDALRERHLIAGGVRLTFRHGADVKERLERFVAAESQCCPFLAMDLARAGDDLVLEITGPAEAAPIVEELFA